MAAESGQKAGLRVNLTVFQVENGIKLMPFSWQEPCRAAFFKLGAAGDEVLNTGTAVHLGACHNGCTAP